MTRMISMSVKELSKVEVIEKLAQKAVNQKQAAHALGVTDRQIRRLLKTIKNMEQKG